MAYYLHHNAKLTTAGIIGLCVAIGVVVCVGIGLIIWAVVHNYRKRTNQTTNPAPGGSTRVVTSGSTHVVNPYNNNSNGNPLSGGNGNGNVGYYYYNSGSGGTAAAPTQDIYAARSSDPLPSIYGIRVNDSKSSYDYS